MKKGQEFSEAWNFGPNARDAKSVKWIVEKLCENFSGASWKAETNKLHHEAGVLKLDISKANDKLGWVPRWDIETALNKTVEWHKAWRSNQNMSDLTVKQIKIYSAA